MIYYTADLHLGEKAVMELCKRPFATVEEMDETIIRNWNETVGKRDHVYILGDVTGKLSEGSTVYVDRLNGIKHLIIGNHDRRNLTNRLFTEHFASIDEYLVIKDHKHKVVLFHYPIAEWEGFFTGYYHIFGHIHNSAGHPADQLMPTLPKAYNAGMDVNGFTPRTLNELKAAFSADTK